MKAEIVPKCDTCPLKDFLDAIENLIEKPNMNNWGMEHYISSKQLQIAIEKVRKEAAQK